jgi:hypothetical protein
MYERQRAMAPIAEETSLVHRIPQAELIRWLSADNRYENPTRGGNVRASLACTTVTQGGDASPELELRFILTRDNS